MACPKARALFDDGCHFCLQSRLSWVLLGSLGFSCVLLGCLGFSWVLLGSLGSKPDTRRRRHLGLSWVLWGFRWVLLGSLGFSFLLGSLRFSSGSLGFSWILVVFVKTVGHRNTQKQKMVVHWLP